MDPHVCASSLIPDESPRIQYSRKRWIGSRFILTQVSSVTQSRWFIVPVSSTPALCTEHIMRHGQDPTPIFSSILDNTSLSLKGLQETLAFSPISLGHSRRFDKPLDTIPLKGIPKIREKIEASEKRSEERRTGDKERRGEKNAWEG